MPPKPEQIFIFPDTEPDLIEVTSEASPYVGQATPDDDNEGDLLAFQQGTPTDATLQLNYKLNNGCGVNSIEAGWGYLEDGGSNGDLVATDYIGYPRRFDGPAPTTEWRAMCGCYDPVNERELIARVNNVTTQVTFYYRDTGDEFTNWQTLVTLSPTRGLTAANGDLALIALPDGSLRLFVKYSDGYTAANVDIYGSTDGGATWTRYVTGLMKADDLSPITLNYFNAEQSMRVAISGDWVRFCYVYDDGGGNEYVHTWVSNDRCATWEEISTTTVDMLNADNGGSYDQWLYNLVGLDDNAGTFLLLMSADAANLTLDGYTASGRDDWAANTHFDHTAGNAIQRVSAVLTPRFLVVFVSEDDGSTGQLINGIFYKREDLFDAGASALNANGTLLPNYNGSMSANPSRLTSFWAGDKIVLVGGLTNPDASGDVIAGSACWEMHGWTRRSLAGLVDSSWTLMAWENTWGDPDQSPDSPISVATGGDFAENWTSDRWRVYSTAPHGSAICRTQYANAGQSWAIDGLFSLTMNCQAGDSTQESVGARIVAVGATGETSTVWLHCDDIGFQIADAGAGTTIYGAATDMTGWHEFRFAFHKDGATHKMDVSWAALTTGIPYWESSGALSLDKTSVRTEQNFRWGLFDSPGGAAMDGYFKAAWIRTFPALGNDPLMNQYEYAWQQAKGRPPSSYPCVARNGVSIRWAGGGGFAGDTFSGTIQHRHAGENCFLDSPRIDWRSTTTTTQHIVYDKGTAQRMTVEGVAMFGTNDQSIAIAMNNTDSWGSPSALHTMTTTVVTNIEVQDVAGSLLELDAVLEGHLARGEGVGFYVRFTQGAMADKTFEIIGHPRDAWLELATNTTLGGQGIASGDFCDIYANKGYLDLGTTEQYRYMRLTFPNEATAEGDHRLGHIVPGLTMSNTVPMDWAFSDAQMGNVTRRRTTSGISWAHQEGPAERTITGRIIGDVTRYREEFRYLLNDLCNYNERPMAFVLNEDVPNTELMLVTFEGSTQLDNAGWVQENVEGITRWRPVGDMSVTLKEVV